MKRILDGQRLLHVHLPKALRVHVNDALENLRLERAQVERAIDCAEKQLAGLQWISRHQRRPRLEG